MTIFLPENTMVCGDPYSQVFQQNMQLGNLLERKDIRFSYDVASSRLQATLAMWQLITGGVKYTKFNCLRPSALDTTKNKQWFDWMRWPYGTMTSAELHHCYTNVDNSNFIFWRLCIQISWTKSRRKMHSPSWDKEKMSQIDLPRIIGDSEPNEV